MYNYPGSELGPVVMEVEGRGGRQKARWPSMETRGHRPGTQECLSHNGDNRLLPVTAAAYGLVASTAYSPLDINLHALTYQCIWICQGACGGLPEVKVADLTDLDFNIADVKNV